MYAIVDIAGQQFKVEKDQKVYVHRLDAEQGKKVQFDRVLLIDDNGKVNIGAPAIDGAQVSATVLEHLKGDKVIVFKKKRRKGFRKKNGHRQYLTEIQINDIIASGAKPAAKKAEAPKAEKSAPVKEEAPKAAAPSTDLESLTVGELRDMAKEKNITGYSSMKKADLIAALS
jgi:large subunit ribosomal protein L21